MSYAEDFNTYIYTVSEQNKNSNINFYFLVLSKILDYATLDEKYNVCFYFDDFMCKQLQYFFMCNGSQVKNYLAKLVSLGFFSHDKENLATYYANEIINKHVKSSVLFGSDNSDTFHFLKNSEIIKQATLNSRLTFKASILLKNLFKYMRLFQNNRFYMDNCQDLEKFYTQIDYGSYKKKLTKDEKAFMRCSNFCKAQIELPYYEPYHKFNYRLFIFITPRMREIICHDFAHKRSIYYDNLVHLVKRGILIRVSAYRFFLNPKLPVSIHGESMLLDEYKQIGVNPFDKPYPLEPLRESTADEEQDSDEPLILPDLYEVSEEEMKANESSDMDMDSELAQLFAKSVTVMKAEENKSSDIEAETTQEQDSNEPPKLSDVLEQPNVEVEIETEIKAKSTTHANKSSKFRDPFGFDSLERIVDEFVAETNAKKSQTTQEQDSDE